MLGSKDDIFHSGGARCGGPSARVVEVGVEVVEVALVCSVVDALAALDPFVARWQRIQPPVDEHPEPIVGEPGGIASCWCWCEHRCLLRITMQISAIL